MSYADADADGFAACEECDDADASVHPDATDTIGDAVDSDCDGVETCYVDVDDDGFRPDDTTTVVGQTVACDGAGEALATAPSADCDDDDAASYPGATDVPEDGVDQDCDGADATAGTDKGTCGCASTHSGGAMAGFLVALVALSRRPRERLVERR